MHQSRDSNTLSRAGHAVQQPVADLRLLHKPLLHEMDDGPVHHKIVSAGFILILETQTKLLGIHTRTPTDMKYRQRAMK